jgi:proline iminopeptidase
MAEPPSAREAFLQTDYARLYLREIGSGRPIVLVHGGPDFDHELFLPEMDQLADLGRLVYYDQRGRGRSFSGETADDVSIASEVADLDRVRAWTGSDAVALIGHSWGGLLAMEYAVRHPDRVSHLVLMNTGPVSRADLLAFETHLAAMRTPEVRERLTAMRSDPDFLAGDLAADAEYHRLHFAIAVRHEDQLEAIIGRLRRGFTPTGLVAARAIEERLYEQTWDQEDYDLLPQLRQLDISTLVLHADRDSIPLEIARRIAEAIPGSRFLVLPNCGHFSYVEHPTAVHDAIAELLSLSGSPRVPAGPSTP